MTKTQDTINVPIADWNRLRRLEKRLKFDFDDHFCACGNYYTSKRCVNGPRCDLGHKG